MSINADTHEFALYWSELSVIFKTIELGSLLHIDDPGLIHRVGTILRMKPHEKLCLFDQTYHIKINFQVIEKHKLIVELVSKQANVQLSPRINVLLPILQRDALCEAIYNGVELGSQEIWLVTTQKSQKLRNLDHDMQRLRNIAIAAAEQSKHFAFPDIQAPRPLPELLPLFDYKTSLALFCDPAGEKIMNSIDQFHSNEFNEIILMIGPEGDLTNQEKELVRKYPFRFTALTPTILRAQQAVAVSLGIIRSMI